jgi:hypothetical protein
MTNPVERKPVGITSNGDILYVVCSDGSVWVRDPDRSAPGRAAWEELEPIPDSESASGQQQ